MGEDQWVWLDEWEDCYSGPGWDMKVVWTGLMVVIKRNG